jgi:hypothetical protein
MTTGNGHGSFGGTAGIKEEARELGGDAREIVSEMIPLQPGATARAG